MKTSPSSCAPLLEALEPRLAPAGIVNFTTSGGVLTITGDEEANGVLITHIPATGSWRITDSLGGSTFNLNGVATAAPFDIPAQNGVKVDLKGNNDQFEFRPSLSPSGLILSGGIDVKMGSGNDYVELGYVSGYTMVVNGPVTVDGGEGNDTISVWMDATFANAVKILAGAGNDTLKFDGSSAEQVYQKGLTIDMGTGADTLTVQPLRMAVTGPLNIKMSGGDGLAQAIDINSSFATFNGPVNIAVPLGNATVILGNDSTDQLRFGNGLKVTTGNGDDAVNFGGQIHSASAIALDLKNGSNNTVFGANGALFGTSISIKGGLATDNVISSSNHNLVLASNLVLTLGADTNTLALTAGANLTAANLSFASLGGTDVLSFSGQNLYLTGSLTAKLGNGTNVVSITNTGTTFIGGSFNYSGGIDVDQISFNTPNARINGNMVISAGAGTNSTSLQGAALHIGQGFSYTGGVGSDTVESTNGEFVVIKAVSFKAGGNLGADVLSLRPVTGSIGSLIYTGGNGVDALALGHTDGSTTTHLSVLGNVSFNPGAGVSQLYITDTYIQGKLDMKSASKGTDVDLVSISQSVFHGAVNITLGGGDSSTLINDSFFRSNVSLNTGAGNDSVFLETSAGTSSKNYWYGTVKILTGAGNDEIGIGLTVPPDANAGNVFHQNVVVDAGADVDLFQTGGSTYNAGSTLTQLNFP